MRVYDKHFIGGSWVESQGVSAVEVVNPFTEEAVAQVAQGGPADVDGAVGAASHAFVAWSELPLDERLAQVERLAKGMAGRFEELARTVSLELGAPLVLSEKVHVGLPLKVIDSMPEVARAFQWEEQIGHSSIVHEPIGVVGCITPWNYPLHQIMAKVAPALVAGCTVVLKPANLTPLTALLLAEIVDTVGLPPGVFNLVTGSGPTVGEAIIDMLSFTGSTPAGRRVSELGSETVKRVALELGGKSANLILDDADFSRAVQTGVARCLVNSGQTCTAWSRMLVPASRLGEVEELALRALDRYCLGDPFDPRTNLGPLVSSQQQKIVRGYIDKGVQEGAKLLAGGSGVPEGVERGYFVRPTVFSEVRSNMSVCQEEIFGPVLSILAYDDEDDAVRLANDSAYGLAGGVWSAHQDRARQVARRLRTGQVDVNGARFNHLAPFGGYKQSGNGRELGPYGLAEFLEVKAIQH